MGGKKCRCTARSRTATCLGANDPHRNCAGGGPAHTGAEPDDAAGAGSNSREVERGASVAGGRVSRGAARGRAWGRVGSCCWKAGQAAVQTPARLETLVPFLAPWPTHHRSWIVGQRHWPRCRPFRGATQTPRSWRAPFSPRRVRAWGPLLCAGGAGEQTARSRRRRGVAAGAAAAAAPCRLGPEPRS